MHDKFDPSVQCGAYRIVREDLGADPLMKVKEELEVGMKAIVPPEYRRHVRWIARSMWSQMALSVAWKYSPPKQAGA